MGSLITNIFYLYIDRFFFKLRKSRFGRHIYHVYMGGLSYANDISTTCPNIHGLYFMLNYNF